MFGKIFSKTIEPKAYVLKPISLIGWRNNMWVMTPDGVGIIFKLDVESEIHMVDKQGFTYAVRVFPTQALRQAKYKEIPAGRMKCSKEQATALGYF